MRVAHLIQNACRGAQLRGNGVVFQLPEWLFLHYNFHCPLVHPCVIVSREVMPDGLRGRNVAGPIIFIIGWVNSVAIGRENCMAWIPLVSGFAMVREWLRGVAVVIGAKTDVHTVVELAELFWRSGLGVLVIWKAICCGKESCLLIPLFWVIPLELFESGKQTIGYGGDQWTFSGWPLIPFCPSVRSWSIPGWAIPPLLCPFKPFIECIPLMAFIPLTLWQLILLSVLIPFMVLIPAIPFMPLMVLFPFIRPIPFPNPLPIPFIPPTALTCAIPFNPLTGPTPPNPLTPFKPPMPFTLTFKPFRSPAIAFKPFRLLAMANPLGITGLYLIHVGDTRV